jgi:hypothetical protein
VRRALILLSCVGALAAAPVARADTPLTETPFVSTWGADAPTCLSARRRAICASPRWAASSAWSLPGSRWTTVGLPATALGFGTPAGRPIDVIARAAAPGGA